MLKYDPIEDKEEYKEIFKNIDDEIEKLLKEKGVEHGLGYVHIFDELKKSILKEKYGIEWKTISEMNPDIEID